MIYAITNRKLVSGDEAVYFKQIEKIAGGRAGRHYPQRKGFILSGI